MESNDFDYVEDIEKKLKELTEKITKGEDIEVRIRGRRVIVERLHDNSFRVPNDVIDVRPGDPIVLPSGEERQVTWAITDLNRKFGEPFYIYFRTTER